MLCRCSILPGLWSGGNSDSDKLWFEPPDFLNGSWRLRDVSFPQSWHWNPEVLLLEPWVKDVMFWLKSQSLQLRVPYPPMRWKRIPFFANSSGLYWIWFALCSFNIDQMKIHHSSTKPSVKVMRKRIILCFEGCFRPSMVFVNSVPRALSTSSEILLPAGLKATNKVPVRRYAPIKIQII